MTAIDYSAIQQPVLVTGGNTFIGTRLISHLVSQGIKVRALLGADATADLPRKTELIHGDIGERLDVERAMKGIKTVFHLAAVEDDWGTEAAHRRVTIGGTEHVFAAASAFGARVVLGSSVAVYADGLSRGVCREEQPAGVPQGTYSEARQAQERIAWSSCARVHWSIVRPGHIYGPGSKPWVNDALSLLRWRLPTLIDRGDYVAGLAHVDNVIDIMLLCSYRKEAKHQIFNAADDSNVTWHQYVTDLALNTMLKPRSLPRFVVRTIAPMLETVWASLNLKNRPPVTCEAVQFFGSHNRISMEKAKRLLGYTRRVEYADAIRELAESLRAANMEFMDEQAGLVTAQAS